MRHLTMASPDRPRRVLVAVLTALPAVLALASSAATDSPARAEAGSRTGSAAVGPAGAAAAAGGQGEWPITVCGTYTGTGCSPIGARVDLAKPTFANPTTITNPLFKVSNRSVVQLGTVGGKRFRSETTLLPHTGTVEWDGRKIEVVVSQYLAYLDGKITEIAIDRYAQADDGAVWYLGEDVFDYTNGTISVSEGTWLAGRDGPPAMIAPARPKVGDVFRAENVTGVVFEELRVKAVGQTVEGPSGPIQGAIIVDELKVDGAHSEKVLAPGYGEFRTTDGADVEALAVAVPTDALDTQMPAALRNLTTGAWGVLENSRLADWGGAAATTARMNAYWTSLQPTKLPRLVADRMRAALTSLTRSVRARQGAKVAKAAIEAAQAGLDLQLRYLPVEKIDVERIHLHAQQLRVYATAKSLAGLTSEVAIIEWIEDRIPLSPSDRQDIDGRIRDLRTAADAKNLAGAADHAARLAARLRDLV